MEQKESKKQKVGKHYWRFVWFICVIDPTWGQFAWCWPSLFFFALLRSKTKSMSLKIQKRVGQYRQEHQIQTCFAVCIKAVNFRLQLFWIIFWPDWKFFRTWSAWIKLLWRHFYWVKKRAELTANDYMQEWKTESQVNKWKH